MEMVADLGVASWLLAVGAWLATQTPALSAVSGSQKPTANSQQLIFQSSAAHQVDREAAQPMAPLVVLALDAVESGLFQSASERGERPAARVGVRQPGHDAFKHPGAAQVQTGQVI